MHVLLVNGSPHSEGNTYTALSEIARQLQEEGISSEIFWIGNQPVRGCIACMRCVGAGRCIFNDDPANQIIEKMHTADAIIMGTPVYYGQPSGQLLCLQQRMLYAGTAVFRGKPAAAVTVCRRGGATAAYQALLMPFQMSNMPIVTSQYWNLAYGRNEGEAAQDIEGMQTMRTLARNMAWILKKLHGLPAPDQLDYEPRQAMSFIR